MVGVAQAGLLDRPPENPQPSQVCTFIGKMSHSKAHCEYSAIFTVFLSNSLVTGNASLFISWLWFGVAPELFCASNELNVQSQVQSQAHFKVCKSCVYQICNHGCLHHKGILYQPANISCQILRIPFHAPGLPNKEFLCASVEVTFL